MSRIPQGPRGLPVDSVALVILDGWGLGEPGPGNAISLAETPCFDELWNTYPRTTLSASGPDVGLPEGQMGNSEVGHMNLGAGSVVKQDLMRIDESIADGSFFENEALCGACTRARQGGRGRLHLMGLVSDGGVHSGWEHLEALIELAAREGVPDIVVHTFTDGRDTLPTSSPGYIAEVERWLHRAGRIGTVSGRYYAMDRDGRWDRTKLAYDAIVYGEGEKAASAAEAIEAAYARGETDEFIRPTIVGDEAEVGPGDAVVMFNFRPDRARQLTRALGEPDFSEFPRGADPAVHLVTMTRYRAEWDYPVAFPPRPPSVTIAEVIAGAGDRQLHVAETEKYAHVTYFFNGGREAEWEGEEHCLVPSPREVATYDLQPEMSAAAAAGEFCRRWRDDGYRFGIINFANPDMVGHSGVIEAAVRAVEAVDTQLSDVLSAVHESGGACIVTADHGNAESMLEPDGSPNTAHTLNPVPFIVTAPGLGLAEGGVLADVAPTALDLLGIEKPPEMRGRSLVTAET